MSDEVDADTERLEVSRLLGVKVDDLRYIEETPGQEASAVEEVRPEDTEPVSEFELAAAEALGLVVPNRISYGVFLQRAGFSGSDVLWKWLGPDCNRTAWYQLWSSSINRFERAGYCRRPQTDLYDIRYKIYWRQ